MGQINIKKVDRKDDVLSNTGIRDGGNDYDRDVSIKCFMPEFGYGTLLKTNPYNNRILLVPFSPLVTLSERSSVNTLYTYKEKKNVYQIYEQSAELSKLQKLNEIVQKELGHAFLSKVEEGKIALTAKNEINMCLDFLEVESNMHLLIDSFESAIYNNTNKVVEALNECLKIAGVTKEQVGLVILTGGNTEIPSVKRCILNIFPEADI